MRATPAEKAMWRWVNVENLDNFLREVYDYFLDCGIWSILLSRALKQLTLAFVVSLSVFLTMCVDWKLLPGSKELPDVLISKCTNKMPGAISLFIWLFMFWWILQTAQYIFDARRLWHMHEFYEHLLGIPDADMQTVTWQEIVGRLMTLRDSNPQTALNVKSENRKYLGAQSKQRMDAHDIANRLMRKENYLIALFNKEILNLTLPIPWLRNRQLFSKNLEWNINLCIIDFVFNEQSQVRQLFLRDTHRRQLIEALRRRCQFYGFVNIVSAPFIISYFLVVYFLRYFTVSQLHQLRTWVALANKAIRNSTSILHSWVRVHTHRLRNGNSANSMSYHTSSIAEETCLYHSPATT